MQPVRRTNLGFGSLVWLVFGVVLALASCGWLWSATADNWQGDLGAFVAQNWLGSLALGALMVVGVVLAVSGAREVLARARFSLPEVSLSTLSPHVGESVTLNYTQTFRVGTDVPSMRFQLIFRETSKRYEGKTEVLKTHDTIAQEHQLPGRRFEAGQKIQEQYPFHVQGMHSFRGNWNRLDWLIHARVEMAGWPPYIEDYPLQVAASQAK